MTLVKNKLNLGRRGEIQLVNGQMGRMFRTDNQMGGMFRTDVIMEKNSELIKIKE